MKNSRQKATPDAASGEQKGPGFFQRLITGDDGSPIEVDVEVVRKTPDRVINHNLYTLVDIDDSDFYWPLILFFLARTFIFLGSALSGLVVQCLLLADLWHRIKRRPSGWRAVGLCPPYRRSDWLLALGAYALCVPCFFAASWLELKLVAWLFPPQYCFTFEIPAMSTLMRFAPAWVHMLIASISAVVMAPPVEELWFRGIGLAGFKEKGMSHLRAILVTSVIFGVLHGPGRMVSSTLFGLTAAVVWYRTGSLYCCMAIHALHNLAVTVVALLLF